MSLYITQYCDGADCGNSREIRADDVTLRSNLSLHQKALEDGWRELRQDAHLCPACIRKALGS